MYQMSRDQLQVANGCANGVRGCVWMGIIVSFPSSFPSSILFPALSSLPRHLSQHPYVGDIKPIDIFQKTLTVLEA